MLCSERLKVKIKRGLRVLGVSVRVTVCDLEDIGVTSTFRLIPSTPGVSKKRNKTRSKQKTRFIMNR